MRVVAGLWPSQLVRHILVDGEPVRLCLMADEEAGRAEVIAIDKNGHSVIAEDCESFETRELTGKVEIVWCGAPVAQAHLN